MTRKPIEPFKLRINFKLTIFPPHSFPQHGFPLFITITLYSCDIQRYIQWRPDYLNRKLLTSPLTFASRFVSVWTQLLINLFSLSLSLFMLTVMPRTFPFAPLLLLAFVLTVARLDYSFHGNWNQTETRTQQGIRLDRKSTDNTIDLIVQWNLFRSNYQRSWLSSLSRTCSCGSLWPFVVEHPRTNEFLESIVRNVVSYICIFSFFKNIPF